jgi:hypothetical protein
MTLYRKSIVVDAMQIPVSGDLSEISEWASDRCYIRGDPSRPRGILAISSPCKWTRYTSEGFWLVKEGLLELYAVEPNYFAEKYELITYGGEQGVEVPHIED